MANQTRYAQLRRYALGAMAAVFLGALSAVILYRAGAIRVNRPSAEIYRITGIDVSHHQGAINWALLAPAGVDFAYIKATEGRDFVDPQFRYNWRAADAAGIPRGAYHFFTFCTPGKEQAQHFLSVVPPSTSALPPAIDIEFTGNCTSWEDLGLVTSELERLLEIVEGAWNIRPVLYVTSESFNRVLTDRISGYPIWIRSIFSEPDPDAFHSWSIWQFSDNSRLPGISQLVDRNALRPGLSLADLRVPAPHNGPSTLPLVQPARSVPLRGRRSRRRGTDRL